MNFENYGGLIETMYSQYKEEEIPENIKKFKERVDSLFLCTNLYGLRLELKSFSENERNYFNCICLDNLFEIIKMKNYNTVYISITEFLFIISARYGYISVINKLLENKVNEKIIREALTWAAGNGYLDIVKRLLKVGINIDKYGNALLWASEKGHTEIVLALLENGVDLHWYNDISLRWASRNGHLAVVKLLLEKGADVHAIEDEALRHASRDGRLEVVNFLLNGGDPPNVEKRANLNAKNNYALRWAEKNGHSAVVNRLKEAEKK